VITAYLVGDVQLLERLRALPGAINSGLLRGIAQLGIELQRHVQQDKLSGQVLRSRTGSLRSSISLQVDRSGGAVTASVFTDSRYADYPYPLWQFTLVFDLLPGASPRRRPFKPVFSERCPGGNCGRLSDG